MYNCPCCNLPKRSQYCASCIREGVGQHSVIKKNVQQQVDVAVKHAEKLLDGGHKNSRGAEEWRQLRAEVAAAEERVASLRRQLKARTAEAKKARDAVVRSDYLQRAQVIENAKRDRPNAADLRANIALVRSKQHEVGKRIIHARRVLVREVVDVFGVQRRKCWEIAGLQLPSSPELFRLEPSLHMNAIVLHIIHLLSLMTRYLSISIPFNPTFNEQGHVGRPYMIANLPFLSTTKWREKHLLWMSSKAYVSKKHAGNKQEKAQIVLKSYKKHKHFLESFALLCHSVAYLAFTQGVLGIGIGPQSFRPAPSNRRKSSDENDTPRFLPGSDGVLVSATSVLELIALTAESPTLGCKSHEPSTSDTVKHMGFSLDISEVVASVLTCEHARWGASKPDVEGKEHLSEGWEVMDMDT